MWRPYLVVIVAGLLGSLVGMLLLSGILTALNDSFAGSSLFIIMFSIGAAFLTIPGAVMLQCLHWTLLRRGLRGLKRLMAILAVGTVTGGALLLILSLSDATSSGTGAPSNSSIWSALGALYGFATALAFLLVQALIAPEKEER